MFCARPSMALATHCSASRCCCCSYCCCCCCCCCSLCRQVFPHFPRLLHTLLLVCFPFAGTKRRMRNLLTVAAAAAAPVPHWLQKRFNFAARNTEVPREFLANPPPPPSPFCEASLRFVPHATWPRAKQLKPMRLADYAIALIADLLPQCVCLYEEGEERGKKSSCSKRRLTKLFKYLIAIN